MERVTALLGHLHKRGGVKKTGVQISKGVSFQISCLIVSSYVCGVWQTREV